VIISETGLRVIAQQEGFSGNPCRNLSGLWAIGFGHTYLVDEHTPAITETEGVELLKQDIANGYAPAIDALGLPLTQNQFDATCSLVYQIGVSVLSAASPFGSHLRARDWTAAANAMLLYERHDRVVVAGLQPSRTIERALFLAPPPPPPNPLDVLTGSERETVDDYNEELSHPHLNAGGPERLRDQLSVLRRQVWVAAVRGQEPDGTPCATGWDVELRAERYNVLAELSGWRT
jgi:lysozyme